MKKNPKYSKRINYDALKDLFIEGMSVTMPGPSLDDKDDDELYHIEEDKDDNEEGVLEVIDEVGDEVGRLPSVGQKNTNTLLEPSSRGGTAGPETDGDGEGDGDEGSEKGDEEAVDWEDAYEQEV